MRRREAGLAALLCGSLLLVDHVLQRARKILLAEHVAGSGGVAVGQENARVLGKATVFLLVDDDGLDEARVGRKTVVCQANGSRRHIAEAHGAVGFQRRDPARGRPRHDAALQALGDLAAVVLAEILRRRLHRPHAETVDGDDLAGLGQPDHDRRDACDVDQIALRDAERQARRDAGIDCVATGLQDQERRVRGREMARRNHMPRAGQHVAVAADALETDDVTVRTRHRWTCGLGHGEPPESLRQAVRFSPKRARGKWKMGRQIG